jgi:deazaflavin-dependent oxidoreductase (nitroreductase family)
MPSLAEESYCYLTTTGRVSGEPREIEIWFGLEGETLYMLAEGRERAGWVRNLLKMPRVTVRIVDRSFDGHARTVVDPGEDALARRLLFDKYSPTYSGDLTEWRNAALAVAVDLAIGRNAGWTS